MSFVFYDTETTGLSTRFDQIVHFAAIKTDAELREVDRYEVRSRLRAHVVPHPEALCVSGIGIHQLLDPSLPSHYEMACEIKARLVAWTPSIFAGYNSIRFDEELLRQTLFQTLHPVYLTSLRGNGRADVMGLVLSAVASAPHCLVAPRAASGRLSFKLADIARANGVVHSKVHHAMSDVEAALELCRRLRKAAPDAWQSFVRFSNKAAVAHFVDGEDAFVLTEFFGGESYTSPVVLLGQQSGMANGRLCLILGASTRGILNASVDELGELLFEKPSPIRRIRTNNAPVLTPLYEFEDGQFDMDIDDIEALAREIRGDTALCARLISVFESRDRQWPASAHVEGRIYDGFPSPSDERVMERFHKVGWEERARLLDLIEDERFRMLGERLVYHEAHQALRPDQRHRVLSGLTLRTGDSPDGPLSRESAIAYIDERRGQAPAHHLALLDDYRAYLVQIGSTWVS